MSSTSVLVTDDRVWSRAKTEDSGVPTTDRKPEHSLQIAATGILSVPKWCSVAKVSITTLFGTVTSRSIGYARTSGGGDTKQVSGLEVQVKALKDAGCAVVFQEIVSTRTAEKDRHQLQAALNAVVEGDELGGHHYSLTPRKDSA